MFKNNPSARKFYDTQEQLAKDSRAEAKRQVKEYKLKLETGFGFPIVVNELGASQGAGGTVRPMWNQREKCGCHSIDLAHSDAWLKPARLAHELMHIDLECRADVAGVRKTNVGKQPLAEMLRRYGLMPHQEGLLRKLLSYSMNVPVDMLVDASLLRQFPILKPAMFVSACRFQEKNLAQDLSLESMPANFRAALEALRAASALFTDETYGNVTSFFAPFRGTPTGKLAGQLYDAFLKAFPLTKPDGHYELVDSFGQIIGFPNLHAWDPRPCWELVPVQTPKPAGSGYDFNVEQAILDTGAVSAGSVPSYDAIIKQVIWEKNSQAGNNGFSLRLDVDFSIPAKIQWGARPAPPSKTAIPDGQRMEGKRGRRVREIPGDLHICVPTMVPAT